MLTTEYVITVTFINKTRPYARQQFVGTWVIALSVLTDIV